MKNESLDTFPYLKLPLVDCCNNCVKCQVSNYDLEARCEETDDIIDEKDQYTSTCGNFDSRNQNDFLLEQWQAMNEDMFSLASSDPDLKNDWWLFPAGTKRSDIWAYFHKLYFGGLEQLYQDTKYKGELTDPDDRRCKCGCDKFDAHIQVREHCIVDSSNHWESPGDCYDSEHPYGPYYNAPQGRDHKREKGSTLK